MLRLSSSLAASNREAMSHESRLMTVLAADEEMDAALRSAAKFRELLAREEDAARRTSWLANLVKVGWAEARRLTGRRKWFRL